MPASSNVLMSKSLSLAITSVVGSTSAIPSILSGIPAISCRSITSDFGSTFTPIAAGLFDASRVGRIAESSHALPRMFVAPDSSTR